MSDLTGTLAKLEAAGDIVMAAPAHVTPEQRREAESFLMGIRDAGMSFDAARHFLENTRNHFVMFEVSQIIVQSVLRQWGTLSADDRDGVYKYLMQLAVSHTGLPNFVVAELLRGAAVVIKRSSVSGEWDSSFVLEAVQNLLQSPDESMRARGLQLIESIATEFSTAWRSSNISITWDFHLRAKRKFENQMLKQFMHMAISTLSQLFSQTDVNSAASEALCSKFMRVAVVVLSWNFSPKILALRLRMRVCTVTSTNALRPPASWSDLFHNMDFIRFFAQLHSKVRHKEELCAESMSCLIQLASVMGEVLEPGRKGPRTEEPTIHEVYVQTFVEALLQLFAEGIQEYEMLPLATAVYRIVTFHPLVIFKRLPEAVLTRFVMFMSQTASALAAPAMSTSILHSDEAYHEALSNFYNCWGIFLKSRHIFGGSVDSLLMSENPKVIEAFLKAVLAPPFGTRPSNADEHIVDENEEETDDRKAFSDLLNHTAYFLRTALDTCFPLLLRLLSERLSLFMQLPNASPAELQAWQEDMHWILLILGYALLESDSDYETNLPDEFVEHWLNGQQSGQITLVDFEAFLLSCMANPLETNLFPEKSHVLTSTAGHIVAWVTLEHTALSSDANAGQLLSPEVMRTSLWAFGRLLVALTVRNTKENADGFEEFAVQKDQERAQLPAIPAEGTLAERVIELSIHKIFSILEKMTGETKLCSDAIHLLITLSEARAQSLARNELFYSSLARVNVENLPVRRSLVKSLVLIGSNVESDEVRQKMYTTILEPLAAKFQALCASQGPKDTDLADLLECFSGVTDAAQPESASILFQYLRPIIESCVRLLRAKADSQLIVNAVLQFILAVTDSLLLYMDMQNDCDVFYPILLHLIDAYRETQLHKYRGTFTEDDEERTTDLATLINILCHCVSKTFLPYGSESTNKTAKAALIGLEMLLPLMNENLLSVPTVCAAFFRLLLYLSEMAPEAVLEINDRMMNDFLTCLRVALSGDFGIERLSAALEILNNIANYSVESQKVSPFVLDAFKSFLSRCFEICLEQSCDTEVFNPATSTLYTLICLNTAAFSHYIAEMFQRPENARNLTELQNAFVTLLPPDEPMQLTRSDKRSFRDRFEVFLNSIHGLLYV